MKPLPVDRNNCFYDVALYVRADDVKDGREKLTENVRALTGRLSSWHRREEFLDDRFYNKDEMIELSYAPIKGSLYVKAHVTDKTLPLLEGLAEGLGKDFGEFRKDALEKAPYNDDPFYNGKNIAEDDRTFLVSPPIPVLTNVQVYDHYVNDGENFKGVKDAVLEYAGRNANRDYAGYGISDLPYYFRRDNVFPQMVVSDKKVFGKDVFGEIVDAAVNDLFLENRISVAGSRILPADNKRGRDVAGFVVEEIDYRFSKDYEAIVPKELLEGNRRLKDTLYVVRDRDRKSKKALFFFCNQYTDYVAQRKYLRNATIGDDKDKGDNYVACDVLPRHYVEEFVESRKDDIQKFFDGNTNLTPKSFLRDFNNKYNLFNTLERNGYRYQTGKESSPITMGKVLDEHRVDKESPLRKIPFGRVRADDALDFLRVSASAIALQEIYDDEKVLDNTKESYDEMTGHLGTVTEFSVRAFGFEADSHCEKDLNVTTVDEAYEKAGGSFYHYPQTWDSPEEYGPKDEDLYCVAEEHCMLEATTDRTADMLSVFTDQLDRSYGSSLADTLADDQDLVKDAYKALVDNGLDKAIESEMAKKRPVMLRGKKQELGLSADRTAGK